MQIAIIGDIHESWNGHDTHYFNSQKDLSALLCVGDLPARTRHANALPIARKLSQLQLPSFLIPGNHDATSFPRMIAEIIGIKTNGGTLSHIQRLHSLRLALSPVTLCGYSLHSLHHPETNQNISLIAARPHAMGDGLSFAPYLAHAFQISTLSESTLRLRSLIDAAPHPQLIFLAHNGPAGLGSLPHDIWGCDFKRNGGDWGDPDLRDAISYAKHQGRHVLAVIAGHMHHRTRHRTLRPWLISLNNTLYINAARCPRIFPHQSQMFHHHIRLHIPPPSSNAPCSATEHLIPLPPNPQL